MELNNLNVFPVLSSGGPRKRPSYLVPPPKHRNPRPKVPKRPAPDNPDVEAGILIRPLYEDLVEGEALAVTADEAVTSLPPCPRGT